MGVYNVGAELPDGFPEPRKLPEITGYPFPVNAEKPAFDTLFFDSLNLLRDERGITAMLATGDN
jgi:hypothetical protein